MIAKREIWNYSGAAKVWVGRYRNSHNLLHWHNDCELLYVERGQIDIFCERKRYHLTVGQALYVDSEQVHYMRASEEGTVLIVIVFDYSIVKSFLGDVHLARPLLSGKYDIPAFYADVRNSLIRKQPFYTAEVACRAAELALEIFRKEDLIRVAETDKTAQSFKQLLADVNAKYEYYTFDDAVKFMGMSPAYFSRYFHASTGITFSQYLNFVRTDRAVNLLHGGETLTVPEIAERCGFGTTRNFNRIFRALTGHTPSRLPHDFVLDEKFSYPSDESFNPTLYDCELIEGE